jgi:hypothetical protein
MQLLLSLFVLLLVISAVSAGVAPKRKSVQSKQNSLPFKVSYLSDQHLKLMQFLLDNQYIPCKRQVSVIYDSSSDVPVATFAALRQFIDNAMFVKFNHFERLVTAVYNQYLAAGNLGDLRNIRDVQRYINYTRQSNSPTDIS